MRRGTQIDRKILAERAWALDWVERAEGLRRSGRPWFGLTVGALFYLLKMVKIERLMQGFAREHTRPYRFAEPQRIGLLHSSLLCLAFNHPTIL